MIEAINRSMYQFIVDMESALVYHFSLDAFSMESHMTMLDLQQLEANLEHKAKEEEAAKDKALSGDKLSEALASIRDTLNWMSLPKTEQDKIKRR